MFYLEFCFLIIHFLYIIHKCLIAESYTSRCGIVASEIPIAWMVRTSSMQSTYRLEDEFYWGINTIGAQHLHHLGIQLFNGKGLIQLFGKGFCASILTLPIDILYQGMHTSLLQQFDTGTEGNKFLQSGHIDAIIVWIAYLWSTGHQYDFLRMQAVQDCRQ